MNPKNRMWATLLVALPVVSFLVVFQPIKLQDRVSRDTNDRIAPASEFGPFKLYRPSPDMVLGLDLQGGTHVVLQCKSTATFVYEYVKPIAATEEARTELHGKLTAALPAETWPGRRIDVGSDRISIYTRANSEAEKLEQKALLDAAVTQIVSLPSVADATWKAVDDSTLEQVLKIIGKRVDEYGLTEPIIQTQRPDKVLVELPGVKDPDRALAMIQSTAVLEWRHIPQKYNVRYDGLLDKTTFTDQEGNDVATARVLDESPVKIHGTDILPKSRVDFGGDTGTETVVHFYLTKDAGKRFEAFTGTHMNQFLAIVMDNEIISCPSIDGRIGAEGIITGFKDDKGMERANDLSILLNAGALPVPVEVVENRTISATLGADSIRSSLWAGLIGVSAVLLFMAFYYRLPGLLADVALMIYCLMLLAAMWVFHATLTLPGIAGIILSIGMAVDANVLIFERIKEELQAQKTLKSAVDAGFHRAWTAIVDSNLCSIITGIILYAYGTGPIKGFAITLIIGVSLSFFTAVTVTRHLMDFAANSRWARNPRLFGA